MTTVIYTDGSCLGTPGPGGWAVLFLSSDVRMDMSGNEPSTTNQRMELTAFLTALKLVSNALQRGDSVLIRSDSQYTLKGHGEWMKGWVRRGWVNSQGNPVANQDLWKEILHLDTRIKNQGINLQTQWVKGHSGVEGNEWVDKEALRQAKLAQSEPASPE